MTKEDEVRKLVAQLREAHETGDDDAVAETIEALEAAVAEFKAEAPPAEPPDEPVA